MDSSLSYAPYSADLAFDAVVEAQPYDSRTHLALAGSLILAHALLLPWAAVVGCLSRGGAPLATVAASAAIFSVDLFLAGAFLRGSDKYRRLAVVRVVTFMLLFVPAIAAAGGLGAGALAVIPYAGLLTVLVGKPSSARLVTGASMFGLPAAFMLIGLLCASMA